MKTRRTLRVSGGVRCGIAALLLSFLAVACGQPPETVPAGSGSSAGAAAMPRAARANSLRRIVRFDYRVINKSDKVQDVEMNLALPQDNERQEVSFVYPEPGYEEIFRDAYGNRIVRYVERGLKPGEVRRHGWMAAVTTYAAVYAAGEGAGALSAQERSLYMQDAPNYQVGSPTILSIRDSLVNADMSDREKARAIFNDIIHRITYVRDARWDPAPDVLSRGKGSCSEYNYAFIALLRACNIPCRYTGGFIISTKNKSLYDTKVHEDAVFHRWTEIFLPDNGWFPADASRGSSAWKRFDNTWNLWGRLPSGSLQTCRGDGGDETPLGWDYVARTRAPSPRQPGQKVSVRTISVCFWIGVSDGKAGSALEAAIGRVQAALQEPLALDALRAVARNRLEREALFCLLNQVKKQDYPLLAEALLEAGHPSAVYFSVASTRLGLDLKPALRYGSIAGDYLRSQIEKYVEDGTWKWDAFEYWWRKARPKTSFSKEKNVFILHDPNLNLY